MLHLSPVTTSPAASRQRLQCSGFCGLIILCIFSQSKIDLDLSQAEAEWATCGHGDRSSCDVLTICLPQTYD